MTPLTRFIPTAQVQDIFIHEAFKGFEVRFYVVVVVEGEDEVVVVFPVSFFFLSFRSFSFLFVSGLGGGGCGFCSLLL